MKKVIYHKYGGVDVMNMEEVTMPFPGADKMLIKVKAVSVNPLDWKIREGSMRLMSGNKFPKGAGIDFSGIVEATGNAVKRFKKGDAVFGLLNVFKGGALAEYVIASEDEVVLKPGNISFEQAAALPVTGSAAIQLFEQLAVIHPGSEVLINGAGGGIGVFAVQLAKKKGAITTAVAGAEALKQLVNLGSDLVMDYKKDNILRSGKQFDVVIDLSGKMPFHAAKQIMKPASVYIHTSPALKEILGSALHNLFSRKKYKVLLLKPSSAVLTKLAALATEGLQIVIGKTYAFADFRKALQPGGHQGKTVIVVEQ